MGPYEAPQTCSAFLSFSNTFSCFSFPLSVAQQGPGTWGPAAALNGGGDHAGSIPQCSTELLTQRWGVIRKLWPAVEQVNILKYQ